MTATRRPTRKRTAVLELLHEQDTFRSAQDIHAVLREAGTGIGLKNVRERLRLVHEGEASLAVVANFPAGVAATITVPTADGARRHG